MPTREQIAEAMRENDPEGAAEVVDFYYSMADAVLDLLSQPFPSTPSTEPELTSEQRRQRMHPCTLEPVMTNAEPPRIEDMAPGTTS